MWLASGRGRCGPKTAATSSASAKPSSSAASQRVDAGVASWVRKATCSPRAIAAIRLRVPAVGELVLGDAVDARAVALGDLERAVGRARVPDQQLDLAVDLLGADGGQHLVEVPGAVEHRDRDGDDGHQRSRWARSRRPTRRTSLRRPATTAAVARRGVVSRQEAEPSIVAMRRWTSDSSCSSAGAVRGEGAQPGLLCSDFVEHGLGVTVVGHRPSR